MIVGVPQETVPGERRVALVPDLVPKLTAAGLKVVVQPGAGTAAGFSDAAFQAKGARLEADVLGKADVLLKVQPPTAAEIGAIKEGATLIGLLAPYANLTGIQALAARNVTAFAMELMPRITRAQSMDVLSAMSTVAGYKAVLIAANALPKLFPLLMTAAGTVSPAQVFVIGAGVAGLQAIGTARRLGAVVEGYDTRPVVREQVESLGAKFVELPLETKDAEDRTGYAKAQSEEFYARQRELMGKCVMAADVVITTALIPGKRAPVLITAEMVQGMRPGSVIVDLAAEQGGNCALTEPGQEVVRHGVVIAGPINLPSTVPHHASQMYARTVTNYLLHLFKGGKLNLDLGDELTRGPLVTQQGQVVHDVVKAALATQGKDGNNP
jgi:NAD(P) transhydrogenase subunit alpha